LPGVEPSAMMFANPLSRDQDEEPTARLARELSELRAREEAYRLRIERERQSRTALRRHLRRIYDLLRSQSPARGSVLHTLSEVSAISREALGVERVSVWLFDQQRQSLDCLMLSVSGEELTAAGISLDARGFPGYMSALSTSDVLAVEDAPNDPRTAGLAAYLRETGVSSLLDIPIHAPLTLVGVLCHEHVAETLRHWTDEEQDFARSVGDLTALALEGERRARAERVAQSTELKYRHLVENLPVVVYSFDVRTGLVDYVSPKISEFSSFGPDAWRAKHNIDDWVSQIHEADRELVLDRLRADLSAGLPPEIEYRVRAVDGTERWIRDTCSVVRDHLGQAVAVQGTLADVTDRRRAELSRAEYERRFQLLFENPELMGVILDLEGRIQFASVGFLKKTGLARSQTLGADSFDLVVPESERAALRQAFFSETRREKVSRLVNGSDSGFSSHSSAPRAKPVRGSGWPAFGPRSPALMVSSPSSQKSRAARHFEFTCR
jgi:PAS domain S-box-containing protein